MVRFLLFLQNHARTAVLYEGGITAKVCATAFSQPKRSFPKISAPGWNFWMPSVSNPVRNTMLSGPSASCWW